MKIATCLLAMLVAFAGAVSSSYADTTKVIVLNVTKAGLVSPDVTISPDKRIRLQQGTHVKLVFQFADKTHGAVHQFLLNSQGTEMATPLLTADTRQASIEFTVGSRNEPFYRLSCLIPCRAMDKLVDYVIVVEKQA